MEYLMTYGWAILIVIIVAAALFALGVFNPATYTQSTAVGFSGFIISQGGWQYSSDGINPGNLTIQLKNIISSPINITNVTATYAGTMVYNATYSRTISAGGAYTYRIIGLPAAAPASPYSIDVAIVYTNLNSGLTGFRSSGTVTGTVS
jgi:hypothetical protein